MVDLSVIVPCYNEDAVINNFFKRVFGILLEMRIPFEIIFIDDGSKDNTPLLLQQLAKEYSEVRYIVFTRNFGKESAMYAGLCNAQGRLVVIMDADLQDPPELIPRMHEIIIRDEYDCVAARRKDRTGEPPVRSFFAKIFYRLICKMSDIEIMDGARDFRMMKREMTDAIIAMNERNRFSKGIFSWVGFSTYWLSYENVERADGKTKWSFIKLCKYALDGIMDFSQIPLYLASWFGVGMTLFSFVLMGIIIIRQIIWNDAVAGWTSEVCVIFFVAGIQLFCMGIMGQYVAKIFTETKNRPHYIVWKTNIGKDDEKK